jgi:hypothetical protein
MVAARRNQYPCQVENPFSARLILQLLLNASLASVSIADRFHYTGGRLQHKSCLTRFFLSAYVCDSHSRK